MLSIWLKFLLESHKTHVCRNAYFISEIPDRILFPEIFRYESATYRRTRGSKTRGSSILPLLRYLIHCSTLKVHDNGSPGSWQAPGKHTSFLPVPFPGKQLYYTTCLSELHMQFKRMYYDIRTEHTFKISFLFFFLNFFLWAVTIVSLSAPWHGHNVKASAWGSVFIRRIALSGKMPSCTALLGREKTAEIPWPIVHQSPKHPSGFQVNLGNVNLYPQRKGQNILL